MLIVGEQLTFKLILEITLYKVCILISKLNLINIKYRIVILIILFILHLNIQLTFLSIYSCNFKGVCV